MTFIHNNSITQHISVHDKCIPPKDYLELDDEDMNHESIRKYISMGILEVVENPRGLSSVQFVMDKVEPGGILLMQRTYALGDICLVSALIRNILERYPNLNIHLRTSKEGEPLLRNNPHLTLYPDAEKFRECIRKYGDFVNMDNLPEVYEDQLRPDVSENRIEIMCHILGVEPIHLCPEYYITGSEIETGAKIVSGMEKPILGIAPKSRRIEKTWHIEKWVSLVGLWKRMGGSVLVFHDKPLKELVEAGAKSLHVFDVRTAAAVAYHSDGMVTLDSLWTHLAAALSIPQVLLTSCTDGRLLSKGYPDTVCVVPDQDCYPCWYNFDVGGCVIGHHSKCLDSIDPEYVSTLAKGMLECVEAEAV